MNDRGLLDYIRDKIEPIAENLVEDFRERVIEESDDLLLECDKDSGLCDYDAASEQKIDERVQEKIDGTYYFSDYLSEDVINEFCANIVRSKIKS
jgi:hypothetical protein